MAYAYWEKFIYPTLSAADQVKAKTNVYFPASKDLTAFTSVLGKWKADTFFEKHPSFKNYLLSLQPFTSQKNMWVRIAGEIATEGKHIDLLPQKVTEERTITVSRDDASVSYQPYNNGNGVIFGEGVSILGVPVSSTTQRVVPNNFVKEKIEVWKNFFLEEYNIDPLSFCEEVCKNTEIVAVQISMKLT